MIKGDTLLFLCFPTEIYSAFSIFLHLFPAYRLKKCPPPPAVENAEVIFEDEDFKIGKNNVK